MMDIIIIHLPSHKILFNINFSASVFAYTISILSSYFHIWFFREFLPQSEPQLAIFFAWSRFTDRFDSVFYHVNGRKVLI